MEEFQRTVWDFAGNGEVIDIIAGEKRSRSGSSLGRGSGGSLRVGQSPSGVGLGRRTSASQGRSLRVLWSVLRASEAGSVRRMCGGAAPGPSRAILSGSKWSCFASAWSVAGRPK